MTYLDLPESILERVTESPVEDIILDVLRTELPDLPSFSLVPRDPPPFFALVRKLHDYSSAYSTDSDGVHIFGEPFSVHTFAGGKDSDESAMLLALAVRAVFTEARFVQHYSPGRGWVKRITMTGSPTREADWGSSSGPIQYADLPTGVTRVEATYRLIYRRDHTASAFTG